MVKSLAEELALASDSSFFSYFASFSLGSFSSVWLSPLSAFSCFGLLGGFRLAVVIGVI
jgi:hypothetical protein